MNTTALVRHEQMTPDQVELIKATIAKGATDNELALFLALCNRTGLDPFSRQIYLIERRSRDGDKWITTRQALVAIDGFRLTAERTSKYAGQLGPFWCGDDGEWKEVWLSKRPPSAAKVGVLRRDFTQPLWAVARYDAYVQTKSDGAPNATWAKMPDIMLAKCAESLALRKAFPQELSGLYTSEEMGQDTTIDVSPRIVDGATGEIVEPKQITTPTQAKSAPRNESFHDEPPPMDNPFDDAPPPPVDEPTKLAVLTDTELKRLNTVGVELYGKNEWEEQRPKLVKAVSNGKIDSSKKLTSAQATQLIRGMEKKIKEVVALKAQAATETQAQPVAA